VYKPVKIGRDIFNGERIKIPDTLQVTILTRV